MTRLPLILAIAATPFMAIAEPVQVQSGEHAAFSRLVALVRDADWSITQAGRDVTLTVADNANGFDISTVFERMPRSRIDRIETAEREMRLFLNCDCRVSAFLEQDAYVVIDVAEDASVFEVPPITPEPVDIAQGTTSAQPSDTTSPVRPRAAPSLLPTVSGLPAAPREDPLSDAARQVIADVENRLEDELNTAAQRGVLNPVPGLRSYPQTRPQIDTTVFAQTEQTKPQADTAPSVPLANLRISTSRDLPGLMRAATDAVTAVGQVCPPDAVLRLSDWGTSDPFADQIGAARQGLFGELDRLNPEVALGLARNYLYFGFGAEARSILMLDTDLAAEHPLLMNIANVLDDEPIQAPNALRGLRECGGAAALWATLALPEPSQGALPDAEAALRALNALPAHLRKVLAPKLSQKFLTYGAPLAAAAALRSLDRLHTPLPGTAQLAQAQMDLNEGNVEEGADRLLDVVQDNSAQSPSALIALVDTHLAQDKPISPDIISLIEAYVTELRDTPQGAGMLRAHAIALAKSGQFDQAYDAAAHFAADGDPDKVEKLHSILKRELVHTASDIVFLEHAFDVTRTGITDMAPADITILAQRHYDLGFIAQAEAAINLVPEDDRTEAVQMLSARISLAMDKPFKAKADLLNIQSAEADVLRAEANRLAGAHEDARRLFVAADRQEDANRAAVLSGDLRSVLGWSDTQDIAPVEPGEGMIARSTELLEESTQSRQSLAALLQDPAFQVSADN